MLIEDPVSLSAEAWQSLLRDPGAGTSTVFAPLLAARRDGTGFVIGRAAQSLDGFIATPSGASRWIGGAADILHTHRLRALCDAVVVGAGTVRADNPRLTTRACAGPSPVRVVIDPHRRLPEQATVFNTEAASLLLVATDGPARHGAAQTVRVPTDADGGLSPHAMVAALAARGLMRLLIEGGARTLTWFLQAGALDRLHVTVAPLLLGAGRPALQMPPASTPCEGHRLHWTAHRLGEDVLFDIPLIRPGT